MNRGRAAIRRHRNPKIDRLSRIPPITPIKTDRSKIDRGDGLAVQLDCTPVGNTALLKRPEDSFLGTSSPALPDGQELPHGESNSINYGWLNQ
jgi:hypothetical protein